MNGQKPCHLSGWPTWALWTIVFAGLAGPVMADVAAPDASAEFRLPDEKGGPEQLVTIAIYLLVAVTVLAVAMLILVMLWGVRVRRQVRRPLPAVKPTDPLWYLKAKKPPSAEPEAQAPVSQEKDLPENGADDSTPLR